METSDFTYEKLMEAKKEILETKSDLKAELERTKRRSAALHKMSMKQIEAYFNIYYAYTYGYMHQR